MEQTLTREARRRSITRTTLTALGLTATAIGMAAIPTGGVRSAEASHVSTYAGKDEPRPVPRLSFTFMGLGDSFIERQVQTKPVTLDAALSARSAEINRNNFIQLMAAKEAFDEQQRQQHARQQSTRVVHSTPSSANGSFLDCVRERESRGQYGAVNSSSGAAGAYQFMPGTWNNTAKEAGRGDLVGVNPAAASPEDQDAMAQQLYRTSGEAPWGGGSYEC